MKKTLLLGLITTAALTLTACGDDSDGSTVTDGGVSGMDAMVGGRSESCPDVADFLTATGRIQSVGTSSTGDFAANSDLDPNDVTKQYVSPSAGGVIELDSDDGSVEITIDIVTEPLEGTYDGDTSVIKVGVRDRGSALFMAAGAPNNSSHVFTVTCWNPPSAPGEAAVLQGEFEATWFEDPSQSFLGFGEISGEFSATLGL